VVSGKGRDVQVTEQTAIKAEGVEIPVVALREPLIICMVLLGAILVAMWIRRRG
jgi:hypothetical protein